VKGLQVGAPVDFRGVTIGRVTQIRVLFDPQAITARIPVIMELDPSQIEMTGPDPNQRSEPERMIKAGLRAQLQSQSLLTGLLFVNLDFHPDAPVRLVGGNEPYLEIPTIPSPFEQLQESAGDVAARMPALLDQLNGLLADLNQALDQTSGEFGSIVGDVAVMTKQASEAMPKLVARTEAATEDLQRVAGTVDEILQSNRDAIGSMIDEWTVAASAMRRTADQVERMVAENRQGVRDFTQYGLYGYTGLAQDAQRLVDQFSRITERVERDPAGFLFGDRTHGIRAE
jgi:paraquat-inducible protein B